MVFPYYPRPEDDTQEPEEERQKQGSPSYWPFYLSYIYPAPPAPDPGYVAPGESHPLPSGPAAHPEPPIPNDIVTFVPPAPTFSGPGYIMPGVTLNPSSESQPTEQTTGQAPSSDSGGQGYTGASQAENPLDNDLSTANPAVGVFVAGGTGFSSDFGLPDYVVTEENLRNIGELQGGTGTDRLGDPRNPIEMEAYLAARQNPLLHEVLIFTQNEGIPPALQGNVEGILQLFGENGIDDEDTREARRYLVSRMYGGHSHYHEIDPLDATWEAALTALEQLHDGFKGDGETARHKSTLEDYEAHLESTYGVTFTADSTDGRDTSWDLLGLRFAHVAFSEMAAALGEYVRAHGLFWDDATAFRRIIGKITIHHSSTSAPKTEDGKIKAVARLEGNLIRIFWLEDENRSAYLIPNAMLHELGHRLNATGSFAVPFKDAWLNLHEDHPRSREGMGAPISGVLIGRTVIDSNPSSVPLPMLHLDIDISSPDHVIFRRAKHLSRQIQSLQQSLETDDSTEIWYDAVGRNEVTADAILNWVKHRNSGGRFGFTSEEEGLRWLQFMDENMDDLIPNAIVHNAMETGDPAYVTEIGGFPEVFGSGTVRVADGLNVRSTPMANDENRLRSLKQGEKLLILGRSEDNKWIATAKNGVLAWVYYGGEDDRYVSLPKGVYIGDLPIYGDHATLDLDPIFR